MKLNKAEKDIERLYESDSLALCKPDKALLRRLKSAADDTFKKNRRINVRLSEHDLVGIQRVAAIKGVPCQSLISGLIHQYVEGDLVERK